MSKIKNIATYVNSEIKANRKFQTLPFHLLPENIGEAYQAQYEYHRISDRGSLGGYKIALSSKVIQELCGIKHPIAGGLFEDEIYQSPHSFSLSGRKNLGIEFELAVKIGKLINPTAGTFNKKNVKECIEWVAPAFEIINDRNADYSKLCKLTMIAVNAWNTGVVIGDPITTWYDLDLDETKATLFWNSEHKICANLMDSDPFESLAWVINLMTSHGKTIPAGSIIITGSVLKTRTPNVGDNIKYMIGGQWKVELCIE